MTDQIQASEFATRIVASHGDCKLGEDKSECLWCTLSLALIAAESENADLRSQVAGLEAGIAKIEHSFTCQYLKLRSRQGRRGVEVFRLVKSGNPCNCYLSALSDPIARGRELLDRAAKLELASVFELDDDVTICKCRQRDGSILWAVRRHGFCLAKDGEWECEPIPSSRDDAFLDRCRFSSYEEATQELKRLKGESK